VLCVLTFLTPFFDSGVFNAATGFFGRYAWFVGFVVWLLFASLTLLITERRLARETKAALVPSSPMTGPKEVTR
jgi:hypothetical protein